VPIEDERAGGTPDKQGRGRSYAGCVPLQNSVTPLVKLGDLIASSERGLVYGNRGCLHDDTGAISRRNGTTRWIACRLQFRGRSRTQLMAPGRYAELFFLDEATALAAGHRPCAECRRADYNRMTEIWSVLHPAQHGADAIDGQLQAERLVAGTRERRFHEVPYEELPDGTFVLHAGEPCLVLGRRHPAVVTWRLPRLAAATCDRVGDVLVTPPSLAALLRREWAPLVPILHHTATA
jgi:hypothetical protein